MDFARALDEGRIRARWASRYSNRFDRAALRMGMKIEEHTFLFTVAERFSIEGRGVIVVPGIPWAEGTPAVRKGDPLILRTPLGEIIFTPMRDIAMISYRPGAKILEATPILLPKKLHKFDIPIGTEVFLDSSVTTPTNSEQDLTSLAVGARDSKID